MWKRHQSNFNEQHLERSEALQGVVVVKMVLKLTHDLKFKK